MAIRSRRVGRRRAWHQGLAAALIASGGLVAQRVPGGVSIGDWGGEVGLEGELRDERRSSAFGSIAGEELLLREVAGIRFRGDVYHPALLDVQGALRLRLQQFRADYDSDLPAQQASDVIWEYDLRGELFKDLPFGGSAQARSSRVERRQRFFATALGDIREWGIGVRGEGLWIPSRLSYDHYAYEGRGGDSFRDRRGRLLLSGCRSDPLFDLDYSLEQSEVDQFTYDRSYSDFVARGRWTQRFVAKGRDHVWLEAYERRQHGDLDTDLGRARARALVFWSDTVDSEHGVAVDRYRIGRESPGERDRVEFDSSLRHRLYRSLDTRLTGRVFDSDAGAAAIGRREVEAELAYRKDVGFGTLGLTYLPRWYEQDERGGGVAIPVEGEAHLVTVGVPVLLERIDVTAGSIIVSDAARTVVYVEPLDYVVTSQGVQTRLDIPIGSRILPGVTILVDYEYEAPDARRFRGVQHAVQLSLEFGNWGAIELGRSDERQELLSGIDEGTLGDSRLETARGRLCFADAELGADYESWANPAAPYERSRYHASAAYAASDVLRFDAGAQIHDTRFRGEAQRERGLRLTGAIDWRPGQESRAYVRGEYHTVDYRTDSGRGWLVEAGFEYRVRDFDMAFEVRYSEEDFEMAADQDLLFARFTMRRFF